jgi:hypothetical protein
VRHRQESAIGRRRSDWVLRGIASSLSGVAVFALIGVLGTNGLAYPGGPGDGPPARLADRAHVRVYAPIADQTQRGNLLPRPAGTATVTHVRPPAAPSQPRAHASGTTRIRLSWVDNADNELGYLITGGDEVVHALLGRNVTTHIVVGLYAGTTYCFGLKAFNEHGESPATLAEYGDTLCAATAPAIQPQPSPTPRPTDTPTPGPNAVLTVTDMWTTGDDRTWLTRKTRFSPGDTIRYVAAIDARAPIVVRVGFSADGPGGVLHSFSDDFPFGPDTVRFSLAGTVPEVIPGVYIARYRFTYEGGTADRNTSYVIGPTDGGGRQPLHMPLVREYQRR